MKDFNSCKLKPIPAEKDKTSDLDRALWELKQALADDLLDLSDKLKSCPLNLFQVALEKDEVVGFSIPGSKYQYRRIETNLGDMLSQIMNKLDHAEGKRKRKSKKGKRKSKKGKRKRKSKIGTAYAT